MNSAKGNWIQISAKGISRNGELLFPSDRLTPLAPVEDIYREMGYSYPKFFKMDSLCKWAWLGAECLLNVDSSWLYDGMDKNKIAVVLMTSQGCLEVDKKYQATIADIPSPALFVYTLSNIMLGEICIRHGFKGEQACLISDHFDSAEIDFWVSDLLSNRGMEACLCGWVNATNGTRDVHLNWVTRK